MNLFLIYTKSKKDEKTLPPCHQALNLKIVKQLRVARSKKQSYHHPATF